VLAPWAPTAADVVVWVGGWPVRWLVLVGHRAAGVPDGVAAWPAGTGGAVLLTVLLLGLALALWRVPRVRLVAVAAGVGVVLVGWPLRQVVRGWPPANTAMVACDVGQGDGLVVPTGPGQAVLVDVGPDVGTENRCLQRLGIHDIPLVLLSHLDADHVTGLAGALSGRRVGAVATGTLSPSDHRIGGIDALARRAGAERLTLVPGYRRTVGTATIDVLAPPPQIATASAQPNDLCLLVRVTQRGVAILFTGDLNAEAESRILSRGVDVRADVLKVPHHGSADADPRFLAATGARVALLSVGADNPYGHPAARTLSWLAADGMRVYRTDRDGDLAVAGSAGNWGVAERGATSTRAAAAPTPGPPPVPSRGSAARCGSAPVPGKRRSRVAACRCGRRSSRPDVAAARGDGRGGTAAGPGGRGGPHRRPRAPPRDGGARAGRRRPGGG
jgi:competence protein ComEC